MMGRFNWDDWMDEKSTYSSFKAYSKSKLANILFTRELAQRVNAKGVTAHCFHPGLVSTDFGRQRGEDKQKGFIPGSLFRSLFMLDPQAGADTGVFLAEDPSAKNSNGKYWIKRKIRWTKGSVNDSNAAKLWELSEKAVSKI